MERVLLTQGFGVGKETPEVEGFRACQNFFFRGLLP